MKQYESESDRTNESNVATVFASKKGWSLKKLPKRYVIDYAVFKAGKPLACLEVKCRPHAFGTYKTYMLSLHKMDYGQRVAQSMMGQFFLAIQYTDKLVWCNLTNKHFQPRWGGRTDRDEAQDEELVIDIPMSEFTEL